MLNNLSDKKNDDRRTIVSSEIQAQFYCEQILKVILN